jgi:hypothetical protein
MTKDLINHVQHGWALLAMRLPEIRALSGYAPHIAELCEAYSFAALHIEKLRRNGGAERAVGEYGALMRGIEQEVCDYLSRLKRLAG